MQPSLADLTGATAADLEANRGGRLSSGEAAKLYLWAVLIGFGGLALTGLCLAIMVEVDYIGRVLALGGLGFGLYLLWLAFSTLTDAMAGRVAVVSGYLRRYVVRGKSTSYFLSVGPLRRQISRRTYDAVPAGLDCRAYCAPGSRHILTLEPAAGQAPDPAAFRAGPDLVWNRIRWRPLLAAVGLLALGGGAVEMAFAHPARWVVDSGTVSGWNVTHGKNSSSYWIYLAGQGTSFRLDEYPQEFVPPISLPGLVGQPVSLYLNQGSTNVNAISVQGLLYTTDLFRHPEHQRDNQVTTAVVLIAIGLLLVAPLALPWRRRAPRPAARAVPGGVPMSLDSPVVTNFVQRASLLSPEQRRRVTAVRVLGRPSGFAGPADPAFGLALLAAVDQATALAPEKKKKLAELTGPAILGLVQNQSLRPRDLVAAYGPYQEAIPLHTLGVEGPVAEVWRDQRQQDLVKGFQEALTAWPPRLPDTPPRIEAAICLAALQASSEAERDALAENLVDLAAIAADPAAGEADALRWLGLEGEIPASGEPVRAGTVQLVQGERRRRHLTNQAVVVIGITILAGGVGVAIFAPALGLSGSGWLWLALGTAAGLSAAAGLLVEEVISNRTALQSRLRSFGLPVAVAAAVAAPALVFGLGYWRIYDPVFVGLLAILAPVVLVGSALEAPRVLHRG